MKHLRFELDEELTSPIRFSALALICSVDDIEFSMLREMLEVSDSTLSQQLSKLETSGYVELKKYRFGKITRTRASGTPEGKAAIKRHVAVVNAIAAGETSSEPSCHALECETV